jgi:hypothetical protein
LRRWVYQDRRRIDDRPGSDLFRRLKRADTAAALLDGMADARIVRLLRCAMERLYNGQISSLFDLIFECQVALLTSRDVDVWLSRIIRSLRLRISLHGPHAPSQSRRFVSPGIRRAHLRNIVTPALDGRDSTVRMQVWAFLMHETDQLCSFRSIQGWFAVCFLLDQNVPSQFSCDGSDRFLLVSKFQYPGQAVSGAESLPSRTKGGLYV